MRRGPTSDSIGWAGVAADLPGHGDASARVLSTRHQRLHLVVHGLKHSYSRLIRLVDVALALRDAPATPPWLLYPRRAARLAALGLRECLPPPRPSDAAGGQRRAASLS